MTCEDLEMLMADAAAGELSEADRPTFEAHLAECAKCRLELDSLQRSLEQMRLLPSPSKAGDIPDRRAKMIFAPPSAATGRWADRSIEKPSSHPGSPRGLRPLGGGKTALRLFRYAASVLLAFAAGYGVHAGLMMGGSGSGEHRVGQIETVTLTQALVSTHRQNPSRSDLANCLAAMFRQTR